MPHKILIVAGEASADLHASNLVREMRKVEPAVQFYGAGSEKLKQAGADIWLDLSPHSVVGILEVIPEVGFFIGAMIKLLKSIRTEKPDLVVLMDLPGFNLIFVRFIKHYFPDQRVVYYISPQIWAWRRGRVKIIKRCVDEMLVILPFEESFYQGQDVPARFVGHPLVKIVKPGKDRESLRREFGIAPDETMLAFLPGSRKVELAHYFKPALEGFAKLSREFKLRIFYAQAPSISRELVDSYLKDSPVRVEVVANRTYDLLFAADLGLVGSGTATLEAALAELPMVILGKLSKLSYYLVRPFVYISTVGLPNLVAGKMIVPELLMDEVNGEKIYEELKKLVASPEARAGMKTELQKLRNALGEKDANAEAAQAILALLR
jgi:lipid-A-disaccharide synthase